MPPYIEGLRPTCLATPLAGLCIFFGVSLASLLFKSNFDSKRYRNAKDLFQAWKGPDANLTSVDYFISSGAAGIISNPEFFI